MRRSSIALHCNTPEVAVTGHFGAVKALRFLRAPKQASTPARILASRTHLNSFTRTTTTYGARPLAGAVPDATSTATLGEQVLRLHTVDGDSTLTLSDAAGRALWSQNAQHTVSKVAYEPVVNGTDEAPLAGRPLSMSEQPAGDNGRIREQYTYAPTNAAAWKEKNLAGSQIEIRHNAGINRQLRMSVTGQLQESTERLLKPEADLPDWATTTEDDTEAALTCTATHDATGSTLTFTNAAAVTTITSYGISGAAKQIRFQYSKGIAKEAIVLREVRYRADGVMLSQTAGNGITDTYEYALRAQYLTRHLTERPAGHAQGQLCISDLLYTYDPVGNINELEDKGADPAWHSNLETTGLRKYSYDTLYRLSCASGRERTPVSQYYSRLAGHSYPTSASVWTPYKELYTYEDGDNLTAISHQGGAGSRTRLLEVALNSNRALVKRQGQDPAFGFLLGGLQKQLEDGRLLSWYPDNQLQQVALLNRDNGEPNDLERYQYADGGTRTRKISTSIVSGTVQDTITTYVGSCEMRQRFLSSQTLPQTHIVITEVAGVRAVENRVTGVTHLRYSFKDQLGSNCGETDAEGIITAREEYAPFGATVGSDEDAVEASSLVQRTGRYSGKEQDKTGLYYYGWRYYQPNIGRWLSADPAGTADGLNLFRFVQNNPLILIDTDGRMWEGIHINEDGTFTEDVVIEAPRAVLVFGMDPNRNNYLNEARNLTDNSIRLTMTELNLAIGITAESNVDHTLKLLEAPPAITGLHVENFIAIRNDVAGHEETVKNVLSSWASYLYQHQKSLPPSRKIRQSEPGQRVGMAKNMLIKNLMPDIVDKHPINDDAHLSTIIDTHIHRLTLHPSYNSGIGTGDEIHFTNAASRAFFRKTSKLGLDWAAQEDSPIDSIEFITKWTNSLGQTIDISPEASKPKELFANHRAAASDMGKHYLPITFSELRHIRKNSIKTTQI